MTVTDAATARVGAVEAQLCEDAARLLRSLGRPDLANRVAIAGSRLRRPSTLICVVGEFKQGKSSLVNGLLGESVCPVDDDLATSAITVLHHQDPAQTVVHRHEGDKKVSEIVEVSELGSFVSEQGNPDNVRGVERVDVGLPNPLLDMGLMLVDTPGMGGLGAGHAAATLAFLPYADALLFVSDASSELSAPELEFLQRAIGHCPTMLFCLTKVDLHPEWRRIATINEGHLRRAGIDTPVIPLSSSLRMHALVDADGELNEESGYPELLRRVHEDVVDAARTAGLARAVDEVLSTLQQVLASDTSELEMLRDPSTIATKIAQLEKTKADLEYLRGPAAKWSVLLNDRVSVIGGDATHHFRSSMRDILRDFDESVEHLRTANQWDRAAREIQRDVAEAVASVFSLLIEGGAETQRAIQDLLREERGGPEIGELVNGLDPTTLWRELPGDLKPGKARLLGSGVGQGFDGLRGAQGGVMVVGLLQSILPAAAGAVVLTNPFLVGFGLFSGGRTLLDGRKRRLAAQRQKLRQCVRQFTDDVQFEVSNELSNSIRTLQQQLRNHFTSRMEELSRTAADLVRQAQANAQLEEAAASDRAMVLDKRVAAIQSLLARAAEVSRPA